MDIESFIISKDTTEDEISSVMDQKFTPALKDGKQVVFVVRKGALEFTGSEEVHRRCIG